ncbi:MAG: 5'/3'-nucleotidase SurE, partial [Sneathiella sp.]
TNLLIDARTDARGRDYFWLGYRPSLGDPSEGEDLQAVSHRKVSVTPLCLNLTKDPLLDALSDVLA